MRAGDWIEYRSSPNHPWPQELYEVAWTDGKKWALILDYELSPDRGDQPTVVLLDKCRLPGPRLVLTDGQRAFFAQAMREREEARKRMARGTKLFRGLFTETEIE